MQTGWKGKIVATAKEVGVLPPEAPQWPKSSSWVVPKHVSGDVPIMFRGMSVFFKETSQGFTKHQTNTTESGL
jgi:hypothetical protein